MSTVWEKLRDEAGLDVSLSTLRRYVRATFPRPRRGPPPLTRAPHTACVYALIQMNHVYQLLSHVRSTVNPVHLTSEGHRPDEHVTDAHLAATVTLAMVGGLPGGLFMLEQVEPRRVSMDCFVSWYSNRYSVPWSLVGHSVLVRENEKGILTIEHKGQVVAVHQAMGGRYRTVVDRRHYRGLPMGSARSRQAVYASQLAPEVEVRPLDVYEQVVTAR